MARARVQTGDTVVARAGGMLAMKREGGKACVCLHADTWGGGLTRCVFTARNPLRKQAVDRMLLCTINTCMFESACKWGGILCASCPFPSPMSQGLCLWNVFTCSLVVWLAENAFENEQFNLCDFRIFEEPPQCLVRCCQACRPDEGMIEFGK